MSQHTSSMVSSGIPNSEAKYQKALKEISKLINTNKLLKQQCEERQQVLGAQLSDIAMRFEELSKKYQETEMANRRMQQFMEELQDTNQDLRKEYATMERQVGYLNQVLTEQNAELKKLSAFKDERGVSQLFKSYEQRQDEYKKDISKYQEHLSSLKNTIDRLEADLAQQTQMRQRYEDQYNIVGLEINKYRQLNNYLMNQNENILNGVNKETGYNKNQEFEAFLFDFKRQLDALRNIKYEVQDVSQKPYIKNYELLLEQKNTIAIDLAKTKDQLYISQSRISEMYEMEQKMSTAVARSEMLIQENNMLKNRITILQSKDIIDGADFDEDSDLKDFQDKINFMMAKADPLQVIKNGDDNSHFLTMKNFINDLQAKLQKVITGKHEFENKYKKLKLKFNKKAQENIILQENSKLLKGKLQGYERLTEKLHYELERSMHAHEDEIVKMVAITNNLVSRKVQESKTASAFIKSQFQIQLEKAQKSQKTQGQQLDALKIQNSSQRIKLNDVEQKLRQAQQFIQIYQSKLTELSGRYKELEEENNSIHQNLLKYEQLYKQEKMRHQTILIQKQNLNGKINLLSEQLTEKAYKWEEEIKRKQETFQIQVRRLRNDLQRYKNQIDALKNQNKRFAAELDERKIKQSVSMTNFKSQNHYYADLQQNYNELKQTHHSLQSELISLKHKLSNFDQLNKHLNELQSQLMSKTDELNDQKRNIISLKRESESLQMTITDLEAYIQQLTKQIALLTSKLYQQPNSSSNRYSFSSPQEIESRKKVQKLNEQIALLETSVRDEKRNSARLLNQIQRYKEQIDSLDQLVQKGNAREQSLLSTISQTHNEVSRIQEELLQYKSKHSHNTHTLQTLNQHIDESNQKIQLLTEQLSQAKQKLSKTQSKYENLYRDLTGAKYHIQQAEKMVNRLNSVQKLQWEQQRQKQNISNLIQSLKRTIKNNEQLQLSNNNSSTQQYSFVPSSSFGNFEGGYQVGSSSNNEAYTKINFGGSFGNDKNESEKNNIITNDSFGVYRGSNNQQSGNVNYSNDQFDSYGRVGSLGEYRYQAA